jgi:hypothetical protein
MKTRGAPTDRSVAPKRRLECVHHFASDTWQAGQAQGRARRLPRTLAADTASAACIRVGLIDSFRARGDYLIEMLARTHPDLDVVSFVDAAACIELHTEIFDVILYCGPDDRQSADGIVADVNLLRRIFAGVPIVVLSGTGSPAHLGEVHKAFNVIGPRVPRRDGAANRVRTG